MRSVNSTKLLIASLLFGALLLLPGNAHADTIITLDSNTVSNVSNNTPFNALIVQFSQADLGALQLTDNILLQEQQGKGHPAKVFVDATNTTTGITLQFTFLNDILTRLFTLNTAAGRVYEADFVYQSVSVEVIPPQGGGGGGNSVPEPASLALLATGALALLVVRRFLL